ncbi:NAD-dependent epimerase/dehydratase family protein [Nocardioides bruguierae]|uniref:NAD-dependent epimerase/dehydratase family protein n=1 Tax=Nocardioides bruguierae TaxID=2945102 RepID=UPI00202E3D19|nr:NAD-dependent epimerase/dehydratase family protein [Nocardioides bruguierae]
MQGTDGPVLVTGGTGYLAGWVIVELLGRGFAVRATVRDVLRAERAREALLAHGPADASLELVEADLMADEGWSEALSGVSAVVHTASPMPFDSSVDLVAAATQGASRVLRHAAAAGVTRVVVTSSGVAAYPPDASQVMSEREWTASSGDPLQAYPDSKIHAERLAWDLADELGLELTTVLPSFMLGPPAGDADRSGTIGVVRRLVSGGVPAVPRLGWNVVDVRDEAVLHVLALLDPAAVGQRYLGAGDFVWYRELAATLRGGLPDVQTRIPTRQLPDVLVRLMARRDRQLRMIVGELGVQRRADCSKAVRELGWHRRPVEVTILDTGHAVTQDAGPAA